MGRYGLNFGKQKVVHQVLVKIGFVKNERAKFQPVWVQNSHSHPRFELRRI